MKKALAAGGIIMSMALGFNGMGYDYTQPQKNLGVKKTDSTVELTVSVPEGTILSGKVLDRGGLDWKGSMSKFNCTILSADAPGAHIGQFDGTYAPTKGGGGGGGQPKTYTWYADAKVTVVTLAGSIQGTASPSGVYDNIAIKIDATGSPNNLGGINGSFAFDGFNTDPATPVALASTTNVLDYRNTFVATQTVIGQKVGSTVTYGGLSFAAAGTFLSAGQGAMNATYK